MSSHEVHAQGRPASTASPPQPSSLEAQAQSSPPLVQQSTVGANPTLTLAHPTHLHSSHTLLPPPADLTHACSRPPEWPPAWVPVASLSDSAKRTPVPLHEHNVDSQDANLLVVVDKSVLTALLGQAYSDSRYSVLGFLGGSWKSVVVERDGKKQSKIVCHVSRFYAAERQVVELMQSNTVEDPTSIIHAVGKFHDQDLECVGWYRSNEPSRPLQPTCEDIAKQAFLQSLIPDGVGVLISLASSNNPNRLQPLVARSSVGSPLAAPFHGLMAFRACTQTSDGILETDKIYPPYPDENPLPFYRDLVYHSDLAGIRIPIGLRDEPYKSSDIMRELLRSLQLSLDESRQVYVAQASTWGKDSARRMFLEADYDSFLMKFWRRSVVGAFNSLDQELQTVNTKTAWVEGAIAERLNGLKGAHDDATRREDAKNVANSGASDLMDVDARSRPVDDCTFESVLRNVQENNGKPSERDFKHLTDAALLSSIRRVVCNIDCLQQKQSLLVPRLAPTVSRLRELMLFEEEYDQVKDRQKKRAAGRKGAQTRRNRIQTQKDKDKNGVRGTGKDKGKLDRGQADVRVIDGEFRGGDEHARAMGYDSRAISRRESSNSMLFERGGSESAPLGDRLEVSPADLHPNPGLRNLLSRSVELLQHSSPSQPRPDAEAHLAPPSRTGTQGGKGGGRRASISVENSVPSNSNPMGGNIRNASSGHAAGPRSRRSSSKHIGHVESPKMSFPQGSRPSSGASYQDHTANYHHQQQHRRSSSMSAPATGAPQMYGGSGGQHHQLQQHPQQQSMHLANAPFGTMMSTAVGPLALLNQLQSQSIGFGFRGASLSASSGAGSGAVGGSGATSGGTTLAGGLSEPNSPPISDHSKAGLPSGHHHISGLAQGALDHLSISPANLPSSGYPNPNNSGSASSLAQTPYLTSYFAQRRASLGAISSTAGGGGAAQSTYNPGSPASISPGTHGVSFSRDSARGSSGSASSSTPSYIPTRYFPVGYSTSAYGLPVPISVTGVEGAIHYVPVASSGPASQQHQHQQHYAMASHHSMQQQYQNQHQQHQHHHEQQQHPQHQKRVQQQQQHQQQSTYHHLQQHHPYLPQHHHQQQQRYHPYSPLNLTPPPAAPSAAAAPTAHTAQQQPQHQPHQQQFTTTAATSHRTSSNSPAPNIPPSSRPPSPSMHQQHGPPTTSAIDESKFTLPSFTALIETLDDEWSRPSGHSSNDSTIDNGSTNDEERDYHQDAKNVATKPEAAADEA
ncbi:hypothetical protein DFJ77DRAFT_468180, partial [Powellomyces hirtus]